MKLNYDFSGYVTKYNILCSDGRTIAPEAFKDCDEEVVPLVTTFDCLPDGVIGSIKLQHRSDGVTGLSPVSRRAVIRIDLNNDGGYEE